MSQWCRVRSKWGCYIKKTNVKKYFDVFSKVIWPGKVDNCVEASSGSLVKASNHDTLSPRFGHTIPPKRMSLKTLNLH